jgi:hypothetical protein
MALICPVAYGGLLRLLPSTSTKEVAMRMATRIMAAGLIVAGMFGTASTAIAAPAKDGITVEGACSGASTWKLSLSPENNRLEVDFEVDQNVVGDTWKVVMRDNGVRFLSGRAVTQAPSGSFEVRKLTTDLAGTDTIDALAKNLATGETCVAQASL